MEDVFIKKLFKNCVQDRLDIKHGKEKIENHLEKKLTTPQRCIFITNGSDMRWSKLKPISKSHLFKYVIQIWVFKKYRRKI